jgi:hypothetical protein
METETALDQATVQELIQELYSFPPEMPILVRNADGQIFSIAGFEVGSGGVIIIVNEEE